MNQVGHFNLNSFLNSSSDRQYETGKTLVREYVNKTNVTNLTTHPAFGTGSTSPLFTDAFLISISHSQMSSK